MVWLQRKYIQLELEQNLNILCPFCRLFTQVSVHVVLGDLLQDSPSVAFMSKIYQP